MAKHMGILSSGGDTLGLNAAIRAIGKAAQDSYGMQVTGFLNGFRGGIHHFYLYSPAAKNQNKVETVFFIYA
jgi:6-phosphofructokinase